jgi:L-fucose mutarotase
MLIGLDPLLSGEALAVLRDMGHGDSIVLADANFPAHYLGPPSIRIDSDLTRAGRAILSVMPLDGFVDAPVRRMEVDGRPNLSRSAGPSDRPRRARAREGPETA